MIDTKKLQELVRLMVDNDLTELDLQSGEETVTLKRGAVPTALPAAAPAPMLAPMLQAVQAVPSTLAGGGSAAVPAADPGTIAIESPMVGTFYATPNPDSPAFVSVGQAVNSDTVVCMVEAMKVFNEIKAEKTGTVVQCLVKSGTPVEFGQKLFVIKPA